MTDSDRSRLSASEIPLLLVTAAVWVWWWLYDRLSYRLHGRYPAGPARHALRNCVVVWCAVGGIYLPFWVIQVFWTYRQALDLPLLVGGASLALPLGLYLGSAVAGAAVYGQRNY